MGVIIAKMLAGTGLSSSPLTSRDLSYPALDSLLSKYQVRSAVGVTSVTVMCVVTAFTVMCVMTAVTVMCVATAVTVMGYNGCQCSAASCASHSCV